MIRFSSEVIVLNIIFYVFYATILTGILFAIRLLYRKTSFFVWIAKLVFNISFYKVIIFVVCVVLIVMLCIMSAQRRYCNKYFQSLTGMLKLSTHIEVDNFNYHALQPVKNESFLIDDSAMIEHLISTLSNNKYKITMAHGIPDTGNIMSIKIFVSRNLGGLVTFAGGMSPNKAYTSLHIEGFKGMIKDVTLQPVN